MPNSFQQRIADDAAQYLEAGETVLATMSAALKGRTQQVAGSGLLGGTQQRKSREAAAAAEIELPKSGTVGVVVTNRRLLLLTLAVGAKVQGMTTAVPVEDVESITVKRLGLGGTTSITIRDAVIRFEGRVGPGRELADGLARAKGAA
jgi:hypothetical protein